MSYMEFQRSIWPPVRALGLWSLKWILGQRVQCKFIGKVLSNVSWQWMILPGTPRSFLGSGKAVDFFQNSRLGYGNQRLRGAGWG